MAAEDSPLPGFLLLLVSALDVYCSPACLYTLKNDRPAALREFLFYRNGINLEP